MVEVGKFAKRIGHEHPRNLRRMDPVPPRPTPRTSGVQVHRHYGFSYEAFWLRGWQRHFQWFATERARGQGLTVFRRRVGGSEYYRDIRCESANCAKGEVSHLHPLLGVD